MRLTRIASLALVLGAGPSAAQLPPTPDVQRYPQLAAMKTWLESGTEAARHCARSGGLFAEASQRFRETRSESGTVDELLTRHGSTLSPVDRKRLRTTLGQVAGMAAGLADLQPDSASIAYAQLCIARAQRPKAVLSTETIKGKFEAALRCERAHAAGSLERKECVAVAFRLS